MVTQAILEKVGLGTAGAIMKTAIFLIGGVLVASSLLLSEGATLYRSNFDFDYLSKQNSSNKTSNCVVPVRLVASSGIKLAIIHVKEISVNRHS